MRMQNFVKYLKWIVFHLKCFKGVQFTQNSNNFVGLAEIFMGTKISMMVFNSSLPLYKKKSFPLRISSVNVTRSTTNCGFGHIFTEKILNGKLHLFVQ